MSVLNMTRAKNDTSISFLNETILSLSRNHKVIAAVVAPSAQDGESNFETAELLAAGSDNFEYIDNIFLYEDTFNLLYTSKRTVSPLDESDYYGIVYECMDDGGRTTIEQTAHRYDAGIKFIGDKMFIVCRFIANDSGYHGLLAAEINEGAFFEGLSGSLTSSNSILKISNPYGTVIYAENGEDMENYSLCASLTSDYTGWEYELYIPEYMDSSIAAYFRTILPFLAVLVISGFLISFFIARQVYSPIRRLLLAIDPYNEDDAPAVIPDRQDEQPGSEIDLLEYTYGQLKSTSENAETFIEQARPELESSIITDLIAGGMETDMAALGRQLSAMRSSLSATGPYQCFIFQITRADGDENLVCYMTIKQIAQIIKDLFKDEWGWIYILRPEKNYAVFAVQYKPEFSDARIRQIEKSLLEEFRRNLNNFPAEIVLVQGKVHRGLRELTMSYHEAMDELRKTNYYNRQTDEASDDYLTADDVYFSSQMRHLQEFMKNGEIAIAQNLLTELLKELCVSSAGIEEIRQQNIEILDFLVEKILDLRVDRSNPDNIDYHAAYRELGLAADRQEMYLVMVKATSELLNVLNREFGKKQNRIISQAKEYIHQHYSDGNLSISQIAESVGISETYLSSIFTEYAGGNLVAYINSCRVDVAKDLLANTQIIIKDIGYKAGFNTVQNFNRVFKRCTGMTPGEYRRRSRT